jgi:3-hydroxy-5-methyl-1-naphthoate 3-O-methyltransferase
LNLEPPPVDDRAIWDLWLSQFPLPVVLAADELDLFSYLDCTPADLTQIAAHVELPMRSVEALLAVLAALGYLVKHAEQFHLTALARTYLLSSSDFYWAPMLRDVGSGGVAAKALLGRLRTENLASDDRISVRWEHGGISPEDAEHSNRNFHSHSFPAAVGLARAVDLSDMRRMLDVAGGPGSFSIALALRYPNLRCTVADLPNVVANTRTFIERYQCQDRVDTHAFNMFDDAWPSGYDAVFFSNVFHDWDAPRRTDLANRAFAALPTGGRILIHEMLLNDAADGPLAAALFSVLMLGTRGKQFAYHELEALVTTAGFADVRVTHTYGYYSLVSATKRG